MSLGYTDDKLAELLITFSMFDLLCSGAQHYWVNSPDKEHHYFFLNGKWWKMVPLEGAKDFGWRLKIVQGEKLKEMPNAMMGWIRVEDVPPVADDDIKYLVWIKTPSGYGEPEVYSLLEAAEGKFWYNGDDKDDLEYDEVTHYAIIHKPKGGTI